MTPTLLALLAAIDPPQLLMDDAAQAHRALGAAAIEITAVTTREGGRSEVKTGLRYRRPDGIEVTLTVPPATSPLRTVFVGRGETVVLDRKLLQYVRAPFERDEEAPAALKRVEPATDDLVLALAEAEGIYAWLERFRQSQPWTWEFRGSETILRHASGPTQIALVFGRADRRLRRLSVQTGTGTTTWSLRYGTPPNRLAFEPPTGAYAVGELDPMVIPPTYADTTARQVTERMLRAYDRPSRLSFEVSGSDPSKEVWIADGRVRQRDRWVDWSYDGRTLTLVHQNRRTVYTGPARLNDVINAVAAAGTRIDPMVRVLMRGKNPYRAVLGRRAFIRVTGRMTVEGRGATLLRAESPAANMSFVLRTDDGTILSVATETRDVEGRPLAIQTRQFRYGLPGGTSPIVPAGFAERPLRALIPIEGGS